MSQDLEKVKENVIKIFGGTASEATRKAFSKEYSLVCLRKNKEAKGVVKE